MASKRTLIFATILLSCLSCSTSIRELNLSKHLVIGNDSKGGFIPEPIFSNSPGNSSTSIGALSQLHYHVARYTLTETNFNLFGVRAKVTVWKILDVQPLSSSLAFIGAHNTDTSNDMIIAGVHVDPGLYNNDDLRFFTYWGSNSKGCYNLNCPGFVVADGANLLPGQALAPLSNYGGPESYITIRIKKDQNTGDWSLYREDKGGPIGGMTLLGWWPKTLFTGLSDHASTVEWTGAVFHYDTVRSPSMGNGHYSSELNRKAASFKQIYAFDDDGKVFEPVESELDSYMDKKDCYTLSPLYETQHDDRIHFFYGGPGGCAD